ncbi:MAG TPA: DUF1587 domain-containing protein, partial [Planctomycetota bacterium]|nr:DUF1587 domain-containing protein [Planctomycetota bacterium]
MIRWASTLLAALLGFVFLSPASPQSAPADDAFGKNIQPLLAKYCTKCHGGSPGKPKADLNLVRFTTEAQVRAERKLWREAITKLQSHEMPPEECKVQPTPKEREDLMAAVQAALSKVDPNAPQNPGRVTVRRLNRTEYGNTIRDLTGIDFDPAEDFPSDDVGYGFDNIGDVLTVSPVLMERYLSAAETIVGRIFPVDPPKPTDNHTGAKYLEPASANVPQTKFRPLRAEKGDAVRTGPLFHEYHLQADAEYLFRFRAYAKGKAVKVAVLACGKNVTKPATDADVAKLSGAALQGLKPFRILETLEVPAAPEKDGKIDEKEAKKYEIKVSAVPGVERLAVGLFKGADGEPVPEVLIDGFQFTGPLDPRPMFQRQAMAAVLNKPKSEQARSILRSFADRAFRRPVTDLELGRLTRLVEKIEAGGEKWEAGIERALESILVSPKFLFRMELDDKPDAAPAHPLSEYQLASRLSYFL